MLMIRSVVSILSVAMMVLGAGGASGQAYPNKPIRIVTGSTAQEFIARLIAQGIAGPLGQPVIVDTRPSVVVAANTIAKAQPDGYSVLLTAGTFYIAPLTRKTPYDPVTDFAPLTLVGRAPLILFANPSLPVKSVKELIAYAKARPGEINHSIGGLGGGGHLAAELFKTMAGVNMVAVPYSSGSAEMTDLVGGRLQLTIAPLSPLMEQVKTGKLKALAVTSLEPSPLAPAGSPPIAATLPGYEWTNRTFMLAPAKTPAAIVNQLNQEIVRVLNSAEVKERLFNAGVEVVGNSPEQLSAILKAETAKISKLIKDIGLAFK